MLFLTTYFLRNLQLEYLNEALLTPSYQPAYLNVAQHFPFQDPVSGKPSAATRVRLPSSIHPFQAHEAPSLQDDHLLWGRADRTTVPGTRDTACQTPSDSLVSVNNVSAPGTVGSEGGRSSRVSVASMSPGGFDSGHPRLRRTANTSSHESTIATGDGCEVCRGDTESVFGSPLEGPASRQGVTGPSMRQPGPASNFTVDEGLRRRVRELGDLVVEKDVTIDRLKARLQEQAVRLAYVVCTQRVPRLLISRYLSHLCRV